MKLLVITCLKEYLKDVSKIFKEGNIDVFSTSDIVGHRDSKIRSLIDDWFVSGGEEVDSIMVFTFTSNESATLGMKLIKTHNETMKLDFPIRAFMMPVEQSI